MALIDYLPTIYHDSDDLRKFLDAVDQVLALMVADVEGLSRVISPDACPDAFVDKLLRNVGWDLSVPQGLKRTMIRSAVVVYGQKGTPAGIRNLIRLLTGIDCTVFNIYRDPEWPSGHPGFYTFDITPPVELTAEQRAMIEQIADYMKPAHTHYLISAPFDHWQMDVSELGDTTVLHAVSA